MKGKIGLLVLAVSLMISQTAQAGQWTGAIPTQTRADWAAEYDTPTVGPAATRGMAERMGQPNRIVIVAEYDLLSQRARSGFGCGGEMGSRAGGR